MALKETYSVTALNLDGTTTPMQIPRADIFLIPLEAHKMSVDIRIVRPELQAIWDRAQTIIYLRDTADLSSSAIIHGGKQPFVLVTDTMDRMMA